jgi:tRNA dimethylallyltransferase
MKKPIIVLTGPTASGKTAISYEIAEKFNCEIICTDSMTIYKHLDIGTDKPTLEKLNTESDAQNPDGSYTIRGIKHHLLNIVEPNEEFNVAIFKNTVEKIISEIHSRGNTPLLVGGSVMYLDSLIYNYQFPDVKPNQNLRDELEKLSTEELFAKLCEIDPDCEWTIDKNNRRRLIRAIEVHSSQDFQAATKEQLPKNVLYLAVDRDREELYLKINKRVDEMFAEGFVEEVNTVFNKYGDCKALEAAGYKQIIQYLNKELTLEEAIFKTKQVHRNYAKRQLTWLRRNKDITWISTPEEASKTISGFLTTNY